MCINYFLCVFFIGFCALFNLCVAVLHCYFLKIRTRLDLLSIPRSGGKMSKRLDGIIGCKYKPPNGI